VEDNSTNQLLAVTLLEKAGHSVDTAQNGREALATLACQPFDVVLMDVQMPEMDGFEATQRIREQEQSTSRHIPIVAMTAHAMKDDRQRCLDAGMDGYISKPIHSKELCLLLSSFTPEETPAELETHSAEFVDANRTGVSSKEPSHVDSSEGFFDKAALLLRIGGREDRLQMIIQIFLDEAYEQMGGLKEAITRGDASSMKRPAHSLKGACAVFGAWSVVDAATVLESLGQAGELSGAAELFSRLEKEFFILKSHLEALLSRDGREPG
jgi:two-component system, sensor histidine kinase and response regulator